MGMQRIVLSDVGDYVLHSHRDQTDLQSLKKVSGTNTRIWFLTPF
jgi:hypothetical protein